MGINAYEVSCCNCGKTIFSQNAPGAYREHRVVVNWNDDDISGYLCGVCKKIIKEIFVDRK